MKKDKIGLIRELILLAIPAILELILSTLLQYVDTAMVGHLGEEATAAVSTTTTIGWLIGGFIHAIGIALLAMMSKAVGAKDEDRLRRLASQAVILVVCVGITVGVIALSLARFIPRWMGAAPAIRENAYKYFFIISMPMIFRAATLIFGSCIRATLDTKKPMLVNIIANIVNMVLDWLLIYVFSMGVIGAAYATAISYIISGILMFCVFEGKKELRVSLKDIHMDGRLLKEISKVALPAVATQATSSLGYVVFAGLVSSMGVTIFAAHSIAVNAETIFYIAGYGLSSATSALIGVAYGEKNLNKLKAVMKVSVIMTVVIMLLNGTLLYLLSYPLMNIFTSSERVAVLGSNMLKIVAFTEPFFGLMISIQGIFYGLGKTAKVFVVEAFSMWGIRIVFTFLCVKLWHTGLREVWYCMIADNICKALLLAFSMIMFRRSKRLEKEFDVTV
ncbi:MAG: MATE family efflux transporter [Lachnospiraceae bacterium]|nr:MATE family efflux transporter [Lachnospiraceae bacterium]